ncbi:response regulator [Mucilaginibacter sp. Bleaf8]|uniref:response regulator n=1 Tax=Mucilaginibacter sp. Bleaf8 TaxID=2834430 RepID=UPI001BCB0EB4|nr:response regulator [Mucilaginibacter sp. Bleaf8]MBS7565019.1 response regulator [Mucilaginibacter sp. Bleaf8]
MLHKILILDDNQDILTVLEEALTGEGYEVVTLNYCEDIIKSVQQHQPDLVMLDFLLAGINGGELCHQVKTNPLTSGIPVVILSAYPRVLESLGDYGSDAFVQKPFDLDKLFSTVKHCLDEKEHLQLH